ncbi:MAG: AI-2E family transporter [Acidobacteriota bacterium]|nr:AI-2E family transporter [Acidobacteriota bacterium]MDH3784070.1 AI-2E family transporter [Acidobacteriota bacterium]
MGSERRGKTGADFLLMVASAIIVIAGLRAAGPLILPLLSSTFLALICLPLLHALQARRVPNLIAVTLTILVALGILFGVAFMIGGSVKTFSDEVPVYKERLEAMSDDLLEELADRGINVSDSVTSDIINPGAILDIAAGTLRGAAAVLSRLFLGFLTIIFILFEAGGFPAKLEAALGKREGSERFEKIRDEIKKYLAIKTLVSLATGITIAAGMSIIGLDYPLLWGTLAFLLNYIPNLGSIIAGLPPTLLAVVQLGPGYALAVALVFVGVNVTFGNFVEPYFMGRRLGLSTLVVFISLVFWGWVWGPVGMLLSVPLTMIVKIMLENTSDLRWVGVLLGPSPSTRSIRENPGKKRPPS